MTATTRMPSRRTIAKGAAWSVPAVAVAAAAPAQAASGVCVPTLSLGAGSCKCPGKGQNDSNYFVKICNTGQTCPDADGTLYVTIRSNTGNPGVVYAGPLAVPVGGCTPTTITFSAANSANFLNLHYGATAAESALTTAPVVQVASPPDCTTGSLGTCPSDEGKIQPSSVEAESPAPEVSSTAEASTPVEAPATDVATPTESPTPTP